MAENTIDGLQRHVWESKNVTSAIMCTSGNTSLQRTTWQSNKITPSTADHTADMLPTAHIPGPWPIDSLTSRPPELRNTIYSYVLPTKVQVFGSQPGRWEIRLLDSETFAFRRHRTPPVPPLLEVNSQVRRGATGLFYSSTTSKLYTSWRQDAHLLQWLRTLSPAARNALSRNPSIHLSVRTIFQEGTNTLEDEIANCKRVTYDPAWYLYSNSSAEAAKHPGYLIDMDAAGRILCVVEEGRSHGVRLLPSAQAQPYGLIKWTERKSTDRQEISTKAAMLEDVVIVMRNSVAELEADDGER